ncbi:MAG: hypothetical protein EA351_00520 [Gemmatimonadales bacterium]|nr:MAG: hypothetical protein EA351_00520 [Gemmatimonadales bacterium]
MLMHLPIPPKRQEHLEETPAPSARPDARRPHAGRCIAACGVLALLMSCDWVERANPVESAAPVVIAATGAPGLPVSEEGTTRWDSPWWGASDEQLESAVEAVGGRVSIGFKDPGAEAGVDTRGRLLASSSSVEDGLAMLVGRGARITYEYRIVPAVSAVIDPPEVRYLRAHPLVDYVEPVPTDYTLYSDGSWVVADSMWAAEAIQAPLAWDSATGTGVTIGVVDSGIDLDHSDLSPLSVYDCTGGSGQDTLGHGTEVTGMIAAAANGTGMTGAAYGAGIRVYRAYENKILDFDLIACGVDEARMDGVDIINISLGRSDANSLTADAISTAYDQGILIVAAAGNGHEYVAFPASMGNVVAVTAVDKSLQHLPDSPTGHQMELAAPGVAADTTAAGTDSILTTCLTTYNDPYCAAPGSSGGGGGGGGDVDCVIDPEDSEKENCGYRGSSSIAAALVSSVAALMKSHDPTLNPYGIRTRLRASAYPLGGSTPNDTYGYGLVQALDAIEIDLPPVPQITISGPTSIQPEATCLWTAQITDGMSPYSDPTWYVHSTTQVGTGYSYTGGEPGGNTGPDFKLIFEVTDQIGRTGSEEITIDLDEGAPPCLV